MADSKLTEVDEGKKVVNHDGDQIGVISGFRGGQAYVNPDDGMTDKIMSSLGWSDADKDEYTLNDDHIAEVTDNEVRLSSNL